jgi:hypothetical protein
MGKRKAPTISVSELRSAVDKSVKRLKEDIRLQGSFATHQGVIFGRVLQDERQESPWQPVRLGCRHCRP